MCISSAIVRELIAAGLEGEALVAALERIEAASAPVRTARQERDRRYYEAHREQKIAAAKARKAALKASESDGTPTETDGNDGNATETNVEILPPSSPPLSPRTPNSPPYYPPANSPSEGAGATLDLEPERPKVERLEPREAKKRQTRLPPNFTLTPERLAFATKEGLSHEAASREFEKFCDHHGARGNTFLDWDRAWQNWVRKAADGFGRSGGSSSGGSRGEGPSLLRAYQRAASRFS